MIESSSAKIRDAAQALRAAIETNIGGPLLSQSPISDFLIHIRRITFAWPAHLAPANGDIARRGALLAGPLFTSIAYPWPFAEARWLEPVLQVELAKLSAMGNVNLGEGWLQVWMSKERGYARVVPTKEVCHAKLTAPPSLDPDAYHQRLVEPAEDRLDWLKGHSITGFGAPFLDYGHNELDGYTEWLLDEPPAPLPPTVVHAAAQLKAAIKADVEWYPLCLRAFGMVNEPDLSAVEVPPVLWVLEEGSPLRVSVNADDGAYVCYSADHDGLVTFSVCGNDFRSNS